MNDKNHKDETRLIHAGYNPDDYHGVVNSPVVRTSTIIYPDMAAYEDPDHKFRYGRYNTPLVQNFNDALAELEKGYAALVAPSGLSAISTALLGVLNTGDHVLITDSVYPPARFFCDDVLERMGIEVEYYDPHIGAEITSLIKANTKVLYMESPGSGTMDIQDVPALTKAAKAAGLITMLDNSWASGVLFNPIEHGVNISILSCTKYINGHSDGMFGAVVADSEETYKIIKKAAVNLGVCAGSEEVNLGLRGLKTIHLRMKEAGERALKIAQWLEGESPTTKVYHPALPSHKAHEIWKRDYKGCNGLISLQLPAASKETAHAFIESLKLFRIGSSWGGYESLLQPQYLKSCRTAVPWDEDGFLVRLQVGLEDPDDLIADLQNAFKVFGES